MQNVLDFLKTTPDRITVRRLSAVGHSADLITADRQRSNLLRTPVYVAKGGAGEMAVTRAELDALRAAGAKVRGSLAY